MSLGFHAKQQGLISLLVAQAGKVRDAGRIELRSRKAAGMLQHDSLVFAWGLKMGFCVLGLAGVPFVCEDCSRHSLAKPPLQPCL